MRLRLPMSSLAAGVLLLTPQAEACLCAWPSNSEQFIEARLVFRGKVKAVHQVRLSVRDESPEVAVTATEVTFRVLERFKGPTGDSYKVLDGPCLVTGAGEECVNSCAARVAIGTEYLVFAFPDAAEGADTELPSMNTCSTFVANTPGFMRLVPEVRRLAKVSRGSGDYPLGEASPPGRD